MSLYGKPMKLVPVSLGLLLCFGCASIQLIERRGSEPSRLIPRLVYDNPSITLSRIPPMEDPEMFRNRIRTSLSTLCATNTSLSWNRDIVASLDVNVRTSDHSRFGRAFASTFIPVLPRTTSDAGIDVQISYAVRDSLTGVELNRLAETSVSGHYSGWSFLRLRAHNKMWKHIMASAPHRIAQSVVDDWISANDRGDPSIAKYHRSRRMVEEQREAQIERKEAEAGNAVAQFNMGLRYKAGIGVVVDSVKAFYWFKKAAEQGKPYAQHRVSLCYASGDGVSRDMVAAIEWCTKPSEQGYTPAQYTLGKYYLMSASK